MSKKYVINGHKYQFKELSYKEWKRILKLLGDVLDTIGLTTSQEINLNKLIDSISETDILEDFLNNVLEGPEIKDFPESDFPTVIGAVSDFFASKKSLIQSLSGSFKTKQKSLEDTPAN